MSVQAMAWAMDQKLVPGATARHVLLVLANFADHDGKCAFPSAATVARITGLTERGVRMKLSELQKLGAIKPGNQAIVAAHIDRADRRPVVYDLCITGVNLVHSARTGGTSRPNGVNLTTERGEQGSPKPLLTHPITGARGGARGIDAMEQRKPNEASGRMPPASEVIAAAKSDPTRITPGVAENTLAKLSEELRR